MLAPRAFGGIQRRSQKLKIWILSCESPAIRESWQNCTDLHTIYIIFTFQFLCLMQLSTKLFQVTAKSSDILKLACHHHKELFVQMFHNLSNPQVRFVQMQFITMHILSTQNISRESKRLNVIH